MDRSIELKVFDRIRKARRGTLFFADSFSGLGSPGAVRKALERLTEKGELERVATGIYVRPRLGPGAGYSRPRHGGDCAGHRPAG